MHTGQGGHPGKLRNSWKMSNPSWGELLPGQGLPISKGVSSLQSRQSRRQAHPAPSGEPRPGGRSTDHFHLCGAEHC